MVVAAERCGQNSSRRNSQPGAHAANLEDPLKLHLLVLVAACLVKVAPAYSLPTGLNSAPGNVNSILREREDQRRTPREVQDELLALGARAVPELFDLVTGEGLTPLLEKGSSFVVPPAAISDFALQALLRFPAAERRSQVRRVLQEDFDPGRRRSALRILGGDAGSASLWWSVVRSFDRGAWHSRAIRGEFEDSLVGLLHADSAQFQVLKALVPSMGEEALQLILASALLADQPRGLEFLLSTELDHVDATFRLAVVRKLAHRFPWVQSRSVGSFVRACMSSGVPRVRRAGVDCAGHLRVLGSIEQLIELATGEELRGRRAAEQALESMLGVRGVYSWREHAEREIAFRNGPGLVLIEELLDGDAADCTARIRQLAGHVITHDDLARELGARFVDLPTAALPIVVHTLASLGSRHAVPGLVAALYGPDETSARHAWRALTALTELDLPCEGPAWVSAFDL